MSAVSIAVHDHVHDKGDADVAGGYPEFYRRYDGPLTCYLRMAFRDADVEAVAQETLYRALTHWSEVRHMSNPWPWLAVTARNLARNNIRDERASTAAGLHVFDLDAQSTQDVADQVDASDQLRRLAKAMDVLTPLQRRLLTVMVEEGLTGAQVARRLGMQPGAVRMHLCRMRARLSERFEALGGQLAIAPVAVLAAITRFTRRHASAAPRTALAAAGTGFAFTLAVVGAGLGGFAAAHPSTTRSVVTVSRNEQVPAAAQRAATPARPRAVARRAGAASGTDAAAADGYHVTVSSTPTQSGTLAEADARMTTPAGTLHAEAPVMLDAGKGAPCANALAC
jgi:RNA polymerase sigma factor (sigma-70 family)